MIGLIKNETEKIIKSKKIFCFIMVIIIYNFLPALEKVMGTINESEILINGQTTAFYMLGFMINNILPIFVIVSLADLITAEYANGTIKLPLLHGIPRSKLLVSKLVALLIVLTGLLMFSLVLSYAMGTFIFGWGDFFTYQEPNQSVYEATVYSTVDGILVTISSYLISVVPLMAFGVMIMFIALLVQSGGVTVALSIGLIIFLSIFGEVVETSKPYLIIEGFSLFKNLFIWKDLKLSTVSVIITMVYGIVFYGASLIHFNKKDLLH